ncbi:glutamate racemase [Rariglobus hedericola]|uniref:Glutamate racemase n=1 Tax=Rariglobus hedericola TaxID=2597822 RepID=A0A556QK40_9BACT|nr:aspartate/glutamate racemase family protein [Rariglobus hedericola]TSJ77014.1 glutamate racemase [Rariglobus hedericola]
MIGVFDSGFGGLTVLSALLRELPDYDYLYLADSARAPYGARSAEVVNEFTLEAVDWLFEQGCPLVVLACNTASARALRNLQQLHLPKRWPDRRVLGVVRPSVEALAGIPVGTVAIPDANCHLIGDNLVRASGAEADELVAVLGTEATIASDSYGMELRKLAPWIRVVQQACPLWVPLVEAGEIDGEGTEYFLRKALAPLLPPNEAPKRVLLGCTHYPLLLPVLRRIFSADTEILDQGPLVAERLADWIRRHPEQEANLTRGGTRRYCTTDDPEWFAARGGKLLGSSIQAERVRLRG